MCEFPSGSDTPSSQPKLIADSHPTFQVCTTHACHIHHHPPLLLILILIFRLVTQRLLIPSRRPGPLESHLSHHPTTDGEGAHRGRI
jgi:hypothetical protein